MRILLTNDDGIMAPGIQKLAEKIARIAEVVMVAPHEERSATGHGITIWDPIRLKEMTFPGVLKAYSISGTPADCVKLAVQELVKEKFDLVISGINNGPNLGTDVLYSGTVSAAIEGAVLGIPSIAVSVASDDYTEYDTAAEIALLVTERIFKNRSSLPPDTLLNVNVPAVEKGHIIGFRITRLGVREYENVFDRRIDPRGNVYYWLKGSVKPHSHGESEIDIVAVENNYVSITPLHFDLTDHRIVKQIWDSGFEDMKI